jgi:hypothetical protein
MTLFRVAFHRRDESDCVISSTRVINFLVFLSQVSMNRVHFSFTPRANKTWPDFSTLDLGVHLHQPFLLQQKNCLS